MTLAEIRERIDALDERLLKLLNERADLVHEIGQVKRKDGSAIYAPEREEQVFQALVEKSKGRLPEISIRAIYREIMSASLALEKDLTIAYLGPEETSPYQAARQKFGASVNYAAQAGIAEVFSAVALGTADYGVVPIENSIEGAVNSTLDVFMESDLKICAQFSPAPGAPRNSLPSGQTNTTRFLVIGHAASPPTGNDKSSIMFSVQDKPGALISALEPFQRLGINISKMESRPSRRAASEHFFFVEINGHVSDPPVAEALTELEKHCTFVKILGTYPRIVEL